MRYGILYGGIKTWELHGQCPGRFAALMPMNAIRYIGVNCFGGGAGRVNEYVPVPLFYIGGVELPCHRERAVERSSYVARINRLKKSCDVYVEDKDCWEAPFYGVKG